MEHIFFRKYKSITLIYMKNQTFKTPVPDDILWGFLKKNAEDHDSYYLFSKALYKKAVLQNLIQPLLIIIEPYYFMSKKQYVTRKIDYNRFITILRQLCNLNNVVYETKMVYNNSTYEIVYYIYKLTPDQQILTNGSVGL